jgi:hypothetical protein
LRQIDGVFILTARLVFTHKLVLLDDTLMGREIGSI